ncbi:MAG: YihY/virulence factor BrkB family protein [Clostridia bacterium]|nr:YihY/virulence factor BrkB family protein [Clostridia bacterium]
MRSRIVSVRCFPAFCRRIAAVLREDRVSVYAAQASFFVITSAVPFLSLLFALAGIFLPESDLSGQFPENLPGIFSELKNAPNVPLLSLSAVTTLWSASRGMAAVRAGIESVYRADAVEGFFRRRIRSVLSTLLFIAMLVASAALLLFGDYLSVLFGKYIPLSFEKFRTPLFILTMTGIFTAVYLSVARRSAYVRHHISGHLPGALFSSAGWILFSYFYSLYIRHFPRASAVYGSLAAVCLMMLWLYFCMCILLFGAVINKLWFAGTKHTQKPDV